MGREHRLKKVLQLRQTTHNIKSKQIIKSKSPVFQGCIIVSNVNCVHFKLILNFKKNMMSELIGILEIWGQY